MKFILQVVCDCENIDSMELKRTINKHEDKVYEDYSSITDSKFNLNGFILKQYCDNVIKVKCTKCEVEHDLST